MSYEWRGVLAGAYANNYKLERCVNHLVDVETGAVLCKRIKPERMCDVGYANTPHCDACEMRATARKVTVLP